MRAPGRIRTRQLGAGVAVWLSLVPALCCGGAIGRTNVGRDAATDGMPLADASLLPEGETSSEDTSDSFAPDHFPLGCCDVPSDCGDFVQQACVQHVCLSSPGQGQCWDATQCLPREHCVGAQVCECAARCSMPDVAGTCVADNDAGAADATSCPYVSGASDADAGDCAIYCASVMSACNGVNAQYKDIASCRTACQYLRPGTPGDTSGDTVACRITHAGLAGAAPNPHCWNAGPFGYGACGDPCDGFCDITAGIHPQCGYANGFCSPAGGLDAGAEPYSTQGECILRCFGYPRIDTGTNLIQPPGMVGLDGGYSASGPAVGDSLDCREYHLINALRGGAAQQSECALVGPISAACR